jgi:hypothetical protein
LILRVLRGKAGDERTQRTKKEEYRRKVVPIKPEVTAHEEIE